MYFFLVCLNLRIPDLVIQPNSFLIKKESNLVQYCNVDPYPTPTVK